MMKEQESLKIAKEIIELDLKRDEMLENLINMLGSKAYDLLRKVQNS